MTTPTTTTAPNPADMPGANAPKADEASASTETEAPPETDSETTDSEIDIARVIGALGGPEGLKAILQGERRWEKRARQNADKASKWDANADKVAELDKIKAAQQTDAERYQAEAAAANARAVAAETREKRAAIANELKIPLRAVVGDDDTSMREAAQEYKEALQAGIDAELKAKGINPAAPASSVTSDGKPTEGTKQLSRAELQSMSPAEIQTAYKNGQLDALRGIKT